jgi:DNA modification methylase
MIEEIGRHRVRHGNLMEGIKGLIPGGKVDFIYSDPPWGDANLKYWQTMNAKMNGAERQDTGLTQFLEQLFNVIQSVSKPTTVVFIEYGQQWVDRIEQQADRIGLQIQAISTPVYGSPPRPLKLLTMAYEPLNLPADYQTSIDESTGFNTLSAATAPFSLAGKAILDPCCGLGYTARLAVQTGATFYGNELNRARLEKTKAILRKSL